MKRKAMLFSVFFALSCQGPWSYWPESSEDYRGIWIYAYVVAGRPVEDLCFERMHALDEVRMPRFRFYENAAVKISGTFSGIDTSFYLTPYHNYYNYNNGYYSYNRTNCFYGPYNLQAEAGKDYELEASIAWDSAGELVESRFSAKAHIPEKFEIARAYDLEGNLHINNYREYYYNNFNRFSYLPPPMDLKSSYFIPEYSDDAGGVLVSMVYNSDVLWGENSIGQIVNQFSPGYDTAMHARFGDREIVFFARNQEIAGTGKDIDSIPVIGLAMPGSGHFDLIFYAVSSDYVKYRDTYLNNGDSRVKPVYNIEGGAGIFAGMLADTFRVYISPKRDDIKLYPYERAQDWYCGTEEAFSGAEYAKTRRECIEYWDESILDKIGMSSRVVWYEIPSDKMREALSMEDLVTWCSYRDFPIYTYSLCGSAMVYYYRTMGGKSSVLEREAKKWCAEHREDSECAGL